MSSLLHLLKLLAAVLVLALVATSCSCRRDRGGERAPEGDAGAPRRGGVVTMAASLADNFDPVGLSYNPSIWAMLNVYDQLVRTGEDGQSVEPDLAESWDISPDGRVYTFHLRPGLKFSDGSELRASDVRFSLTRLVTEGKSSWGFLFPPLEIEAPDDRTVVIQLKEPWAPLLADLALFAASVIPEGHFNKVGREGFGKAPIGSGPFVLAEWKKGERIVFKRNPHHWDARHPYLDEVRLVPIEDANTRMLKIQAGEIDIAMGVPFSQVDALGRAPGVAVQLAPVQKVDLLFLNLRSPKLQDRKVRQAIGWGIDREALIRGVLFGHGKVPTSFLPPMLHTDSEAPPFGRDVGKARALLAESGAPEGFSLRLVISASDHERQLATLIKSQLDPVGIRVEIQQYELTALRARVREGDFDMRLDAETSDIADPSQMVATMGVGTLGLTAASVGYDNPRVNELAAEAQAEKDPRRRGEIYREIQRIVREDAPYVPLFWPLSATAVREGVHGFAILPTANYRLWEVWRSR